VTKPIAANMKHLFVVSRHARMPKTANLFLLAVVQQRNLLHSGAGFGTLVMAGHSLKTSVVCVAVLFFFVKEIDSGEENIVSCLISMH